MAPGPRKAHSAPALLHEELHEKLHDKLHGQMHAKMYKDMYENIYAMDEKPMRKK